MAIVISAFAYAMARAAGLELTPNGEILSQGEVLFRLEQKLDEKISDDTYFAFIDWIRAFHKDEPNLAFTYANEIRDEDIGALALAAKSAMNLRDALVRIERYFRLVTDTAVYRLDEDQSPALFRFEARTRDRAALQLRDECALAALTNKIRSFVGPALEVDYVAFRHECRDVPSRFEEFFRCEVRFGTGRNEIALHHEMLTLPNRLGDKGISAFLTQHLEEEIRRLSDVSPLRETILRHLSTRLSNGIPHASEIAKLMGMSERTFFRRLVEQGLSYREVQQEAQSALARELLVETDYSIAEIAFLTGFSEQSTFSRAFKRWVGEAPARYRQLS
jgi:AraC-like DNA-binding protein